MIKRFPTVFHRVMLLLLLLAVATSHADARIKWPKWKKIITVACEDIKGFGVGFGIGSIFSPGVGMGAGVITAAYGSITAADETKVSRPVMFTPVPTMDANAQESYGERHNRIVWDFLADGNTDMSPEAYLRFLERNAKKYDYDPRTITLEMLRDIEREPLIDSDSLELLVEQAMENIPSVENRRVMSEGIIRMLKAYEYHGLEGFDVVYASTVAEVIATISMEYQQAAGATFAILRHSLWDNSAGEFMRGPIVNIRYGIGLTCYPQEAGTCSIVGQDFPLGQTTKKRTRGSDGTLSKANWQWWTENSQPPADYSAAWTERVNDTLVIHVTDGSLNDATSFRIENDIVLDNSLAYELGGRAFVVRSGTYPVSYVGNQFGSIRLTLTDRGVTSDCFFGRHKDKFSSTCVEGFGACMMRFPPNDGLPAFGALPVHFERADDVVTMTFLHDLKETGDTFHLDSDIQLDSKTSEALGTAVITLKQGRYIVSRSAGALARVSLDYYNGPTSILQGDLSSTCDEASAVTVAYYDVLGRNVPLSDVVSGASYFKVSTCVNGSVNVQRVLP